MRKILWAIAAILLNYLARFMAAIINKAYMNINEVHDVFYENGFHFLRRSYYLPIPEDDDLGCQRETGLAGIDMDDRSQLEFMGNVMVRYKAEYNSFPSDRTSDPHQYHIVNGAFMAGDGNAYYSLIRHLKPRTIIEIGSGASTLLAAHAVKKNVEDDPGRGCRLVAIEPYPNDVLLGGFEGLTELKRCKVQEVGLDFFGQLGENDILFIDSSHVLRSGGDVWWEYCEILPRLKSGVYVHIHDISLPKPYPQVYYDNFLYWNEQYMLQAYLTGNSRCEVVWAGTYMYGKYPDAITEAFSPAFALMREKFPLAEPSSFWFRVK